MNETEKTKKYESEHTTTHFTAHHDFMEVMNLPMHKKIYVNLNYL